MNDPRAPVSPRRSLEPRLLKAAVAVVLALPWSALAAEPAASPTRVVGARWEAQGPGPATGGQVENIVPDDAVSGAVHTVAPHPTNANVLFIGAVNGGIWRTENALDPSPSWTRPTDDFPSLSVGALAFDPTDASHQTLLAGFGRYSSLASFGGSRRGLLRTTDAGDSWTLIDGGGTLVGKNVSGVAPRGSTLVISADSADDAAGFGVFRSTNGGVSFTQISDGDGSATGLPAGRAFFLASDPADPARLFTAVAATDDAGGTDGIYRSTDTGATWTRAVDSAMDAVIAQSFLSRIEVAVGPAGSVYAAIVTSGRLSGLFRSGNGGDTWTSLGLPTTVEDGVAVGIHPGGQGGLHLSIVADPTDPNLVYVGGDRQPYFGEASGGSVFFPNSIGATDYSGRLFRGDASLPVGSRFTPLTHAGTASSSSPHADSRHMAFDAQGRLIEVDDGGIYARTSPRDATGDWFSLNGTLQTTEYHSLAYDSVANVVIGGAQDTGTTEQVVPGLPTFWSVSTADGGDTAVDDHSSATVSTRFSSFQFLSGFRRRQVDAANSVISQDFPSLTVLGGGDPIFAQFYTPLVVNEVDGDRMIFGGGNSVYESLDQGDTVTEIGPEIVVNGIVGTPIVYGVPGNANLLFVGEGSSVFRRTAAPPAPLMEVAAPSGSTVQDLGVDPDVPSRLFAVDGSGVFLSTNSGDAWGTITGNLGTFDPGTLRTLVFLPRDDDALVVGGDRGVFVAFDSSGFTAWDRLGTGLPNAPVHELDFDLADDVLVAGLLGRGAFKLQPAICTEIVDECGVCGGDGLSCALFFEDYESGGLGGWSAVFP